MAYTLPVLVNQVGKAVAITSTITATGAQTPFQLPRESGQYWGQATFQAVLNTVTTFTADLEIDMTGVDANFVVLSAGLNFKTAPTAIRNLNGGNIRYRWNIKTWVGTGAVIWVIAG